MNDQLANKMTEPAIELWNRSLRRLARIRVWCTWVARIATGCCIWVFFSYSQGWWIVLLQVAVLSWILASNADSNIKMLESVRAKYGLRGELETPAA